VLSITGSRLGCRKVKTSYAPWIKTINTGIVQALSCIVSDNSPLLQYSFAADVQSDTSSSHAVKASRLPACWPAR
jgi:hypothetical protein